MKDTLKTLKYMFCSDMKGFLASLIEEVSKSFVIIHIKGALPGEDWSFTRFTSCNKFSSLRRPKQH